MTSLYDPVTYDLLFKPEPFGSWYASLVKDETRPVVELACGTGQILHAIGQYKGKLLGFDLRSDMINAAENRLPNGRFAVGDMRSFQVEERAQLVIVARNSLLHLHSLDDFAQMLGSVRRALTPDGVLAFDIFNPDLKLLSEHQAEKVVFTSVRHPVHGIIDVSSTAAYNRASQIVSSEWFMAKSNGSRIPLGSLHLRAIFPEELSAILAANGFCLSDRWGGFNQEPFSSSSSRQVCLCKATQQCGQPDAFGAGYL